MCLYCANPFCMFGMLCGNVLGGKRLRKDPQGQVTSASSTELVQKRQRPPERRAPAKMITSCVPKE